jgi:hypothetical protein
MTKKPAKVVSLAKVRKNKLKLTLITPQPPVIKIKEKIFITLQHIDSKADFAFEILQLTPELFYDINKVLYIPIIAVAHITMPKSEAELEDYQSYMVICMVKDNKPLLNKIIGGPYLLPSGRLRHRHVVRLMRRFDYADKSMTLAEKLVVEIMEKATQENLREVLLDVFNRIIKT